MRTLGQIAADYERAEVTVLWLHDAPTGRHVLLYGVAELCPPEQERSDEIRGSKGGAVHPMDRTDFASAGTLYAARIFLEHPGEAIDFYRGVAGRRTIAPEGDAIILEPLLSRFQEEPPDEHPVLLDGRGAESYAGVLPRRNTAVRICSRFAHGQSYLDSLNDRQKAALQDFSQRVLGIDLVKYCEHLGAAHLMLPNALIRGWSERLGEDLRSVLFEFYERDGRTVQGSTLQLTDHRTAGLGFDCIVEITSSRQIVPIPIDPASLETRLRNPQGELIEHIEAPFLRSVRITTAISGRRRRVHTRNARGEVEVNTIQTYNDDLGRADPDEEVPDPYALLQEARTRRESAQLEQKRDFILFEGGLDSRDHARKVVRELIGNARDRCMLCDPYLSAPDVTEYATFVRASRIKIRLLGSAMFLRAEAAGGLTHGDQLNRRLVDLRAADASLVFDCRVLLGRDASPIHDRFLMLDDKVFVLGSSLNELGRRVTTIYRAPHAPALVGVLERWWNDTNACVPIGDWLTRRTAMPRDERSDE